MQSDVHGKNLLSVRIERQVARYCRGMKFSEVMRVENSGLARAEFSRSQNENAAGSSLISEFAIVIELCSDNSRTFSIWGIESLRYGFEFVYFPAKNCFGVIGATMKQRKKTLRELQSNIPI